MMQLNKKNWKEYSFGDVAIQQKETVDRQNTTLGKYVAGEHMTTEDIHIRQWGIVGDSYLGPAFHRKFCKDDILYGSRRTYLKKVAVAHFNGITANTTFVIRSNDEIITPGILPFLMLSDSFTDHSVKNSKGSVNPYINWKDIANYKFKLPQLDEQKRLADLLWSIDKVIETELDLLLKLKKFEKVKMNELLNGKHLSVCNNKIPIGWVEKKISQLGTVSTSSVDKKIKKGEKNINLINYMDVYTSKDKKITKSLKFMQVSANDSQLIKNQIKKGDVLFTPSSETSDDIGHSAVIYEEMPRTLYSYHLVRLRFNEKDDLDLNYKRFVFNNPRIMWHFSVRSKGITRMTLSLDDFNETKIWIPPKDDQRRISEILSKIIKEKIIITNQIINSKKIQKQIINQIFGGKS